MPYLIVNARLNRFEPRFKYIRSERLFSPEAFLQDISELPFSTVYAVDDIDEKIDIFNELLRSCIDRHAPLVRCKLTRPPAPWLQDVDIQNLKKTSGCSEVYCTSNAVRVRLVNVSLCSE